MERITYEHTSIKQQSNQEGLSEQVVGFVLYTHYRYILLITVVISRIVQVFNWLKLKKHNFK